MIEVLKQMVDALQTYSDKHRKTYLLEGAWDEEITKNDAAIQAEKKAIAELESQKPIAYVNAEERKLEFATDSVKWYTLTVVNLDLIPLFTKEALEQDQNIWSRSADGSVKIIYEE
jgi:hypothetical protein